MLTQDQLLLPDAELSQLKTALANAGYPDAIPTAATEAEETFDRYTAAYVLGSADAARLQRPLIIHALYTLIGAVSTAIKEAYENAMKELRDIRDGKFPGLEPAGGTTTTTGNWGSKTKINFPGDE